MKILVTGGAGFIGSHVVDAYVAAGHDVVVVDNLSTGEQYHVNPGARLVTMDIADPRIRDLCREERFDVINHHAAQVSVPASVKDPVADATTNIVGSVNLLNAAVESDVSRFLYISSGGAIYGDPVHLPVREDHPVAPLSPYGISKHTVERYIGFYSREFGMSAITFRYSNIYGPRQSARGESNVIAIFVRRMLNDEPVMIDGTGEQLRDYLYVDDCVSANLLALESDASGAFNLGWSEPISVIDVYRALRQLTKYPHEPVFRAPRVGDVFRNYLDSSRAQQKLGWQPTVTLDHGLQKTIQSLQATAN